MDADFGSGVRRLTSEPRGVDAGMPSWTADGRWIYFGLYAGGRPPRMCKVHPDGSGFAVVGVGFDPAVSPDGRRGAFARAAGVGHRLCVMDLDGSAVRELIRRGNGWGGIHAAWTPDSRTILYYADRVGDAMGSLPARPTPGAIRSN